MHECLLRFILFFTERPWLQDSLDDWIKRLQEELPHRCAAIFIDNSGVEKLLKKTLGGDMYAVTRLAVANSIVMEIRNKIMNELELTCSAGIAHSKLLAKLGGAVNKSNQQTIVYPCSATDLLSSLGLVSKIPGVG